MTVEEYRRTVEELELESFNCIRRYVNDALNPRNNDEIAGYVRGVCDLQSYVYGIMSDYIEKENR